MQHTFFTIPQPDYPIACKLYQPDDGNIEQVIIGVHGFGGDMESSALRRLAAELTPAHTALCCFDFPAHGVSTAADSALTPDNCVRDLMTVLTAAEERLSCPATGIFATSFGGYITLLAMQRHPAVLANVKIVLRSPAIPLADSLLQRILCLSEDEFRRAGAVECGFTRKIQLPFSFYTAVKQNDVRALPLAHPVLILHGTKDELIPFDDIQAYAIEHPQAMLVPVPGADHRYHAPGKLEMVLRTAQAWLLG